MKKKNKIRSDLNRTSFQTQLFVIVLLSFILFVLLDYIIIQYSFKSRYIKKELESSSVLINNLSNNINENTNKIASQFEKFNQESGYIPLFVDASGGGYTLTDSINYSYTFAVFANGTTYTLNPDTFSLNINVNDKIDALIVKSNTNSNEYSIKSLTVNGEKIINGSYNSSYTIINNGTVTEVTTAENLNFFFGENTVAIKAMDILNTKVIEFTNISLSSCTYSSYYLDKNEGYLYFLIKPNSYSDTSSFVYIISSFVETDELLSIVSSYYGYIVIGTVIFAALIALFISRAFSKPIVIIKKEITKLAKNDYETSSHEFKNKELISLQDTINEVKIDTKEKVQNIENQRESLEKLNHELMIESELRSSFIARLSHELKTPLMVIGATTEALMSGLIDEKDINNEYDTILNEVDKTTGIIKDIINTYKTSSKETKLKKERFSLTELVKETLQSLIPIAQNNKLVLETHLDKDEFIDGDKELLKQVVSNFITNAFKYTDEGEKVQISIIDEPDSFTFEVKNYGARIDDINLEKIWLPFFRENENIDSSSTGMGLYIVKEILTAHKFEYDVKNFEEGVVSFFKVKK